MTEASFVDTNILVYARDPREERKQALAAGLVSRLWQERTGRTSMQVLNEYYATLTRKFKPVSDADTAWEDVLTLMAWNPQPLDREILKGARDIERRYRTSWWDSLIVPAWHGFRATHRSQPLQRGRSRTVRRIPRDPAPRAPPPAWAPRQSGLALTLSGRPAPTRNGAWIFSHGRFEARGFLSPKFRDKVLDQAEPL